MKLQSLLCHLLLLVLDAINCPERPGPPLDLGFLSHTEILFLCSQFLLPCLTETISI